MGGGDGDQQKEEILMILPFPEPKETLERIGENYPNYKITYREVDLTDMSWRNEKGVPDEIFKKATILVTLTALPEDPKTSSPNLELVHFISAGTNHIAHTPIYTSTTIPLTTSSGIHGPQISEWVLMTMLTSSHRFPLLHSWQQSHTWPKTPAREPLTHLRDKTGQRIGILGYGSIGRQVARVSKAMGMDVLAFTAHPRDTPASKQDNGYIVPGTGDPDGTIPSAWFSGLDKPSLHHFLSQDLDHLVISVPLTKETTHLLSAPEFAILGGKKNAFVSNISRGQIINQTDLMASLRAYADADPLKGGDGGGGLRGAAIDVTDPEPLPEDSELWDTPNLTLTPHISGLGETYIDRALQVLEVNLGRRKEGKDLINVVNRERGY